MSASVLSRLESADSADFEMAERILRAIGSKEAEGALEHFRRDWRHLERPSFGHPDRQVLWTSEQALQILTEFAASPRYDKILDGPVAKLSSGFEIGC